MIIIQRWTDDGMKKLGECELNDEEYDALVAALETLKETDLPPLKG